MSILRKSKQPRAATLVDSYPAQHSENHDEVVSSVMVVTLLPGKTEASDYDVVKDTDSAEIKKEE